MSEIVTVTGMPGDSKFPKILYIFKGLLKKIQIKKFWIRELTDMYDTDCKQMTIKFSNNAEARKARNYLNNMPYTQGQDECLLMAYINENPMQPMEYHEEERDWGQPRRSSKRGRPRSPSPGYRREADKLDMEIELLRKQRQVIEEERRLLLEQKKLEMIREYGPGASREFDHFEPPRKRHQPSKHVEVKAPRKHSSPPPKVPKLTKVPLNSEKNARKGLPLFVHSCKVLIAEMKPYIEKNTTPEEIEILIKLIRAAIRKNLAIALEGKDYMPTREQVKLYRELHPKTTDEVFVDKILKNIRASYMPYDLDVKLEQVKAEKQPENEVDKEPSLTDVNVESKIEDTVVEENPEDKQAVNDVTEPQENPAIEEHVTDGDVNVKSLPDVSQELETPAEKLETAGEELETPGGELKTAGEELEKPGEQTETPGEDETKAEQLTTTNDNFWVDEEGNEEFDNGELEL